MPIGLAVLLWAPRAIPESRDAQGRRVDLPGQLFGGLALAALAVAAIVQRLLWPAVVVALLAALLFVRVERRAGAGAMIPLPLLRNARLAAVNGVTAAMTFGMYGVLFLLPLNWLRAWRARRHRRGPGPAADVAGLRRAVASLRPVEQALRHAAADGRRHGADRRGHRRAGVFARGATPVAGRSWPVAHRRGHGAEHRPGAGQRGGGGGARPRRHRFGHGQHRAHGRRHPGRGGVLGSVFAAGSNVGAGFAAAMALGAAVVFAGVLLAMSADA